MVLDNTPPTQEAKKYLLETYFKDDLTENELDNKNNFVVIDNVSVDLDDLLNAIKATESDWNNALMQLDNREIEFCTTPEGEVEDLDMLEGFYKDQKTEVVKRIRSKRAEKKARLRSLIQESIGEHYSFDLPRKDAVLMALADRKLRYGKLYYSSLTEFLSQFAAFDEGSVRAVIDAVAEIGGDLPHTRAVTRQSVKRITSISESNLNLLANLTGITLKEWKSIPGIIIEKALAGHSLVEDDFNQLLILSKNFSFTVPDVVENTLGFWLTTGSPVLGLMGFFMVGGANNLAASEWIINGTLTGTAVGAGLWFLASYTNIKPLSAIARALSFKNARNYKKQKHIESYNNLKARIDELKKTAFGNLRLILAREILGVIVGTLQTDSDDIKSVVRKCNVINADEDLQVKFEEFCVTRMYEFESFSSVLTLLSDFETYLSAEIEIYDTGQSNVNEVASQNNIPPVVILKQSQ